MQNELVAQARERIAHSTRVLILAHERPDGDAIGSMLALTHMLRQNGKTVFPASSDPINSTFRFLPGSREIASELPAEYDLGILLDCGDRARIGRLADSLPRPPDLNIDHHATNNHFAEINLVDPGFNATAELLTELAPDLGLTIDADSALCLLVGIVTDTIGFRVPGTNPRTLEIARRLMLAGASLSDAMEASLYRRTYAAARYWGAGLTRLEREGDLIWATLPLAERKAAGYPGRDDADLINILSTIEGARAAVLFIEQEHGQVKISWRVRDGLDVTPLAVKFGGGGHPAASGATVDGALEEVRETVLGTTRAWLAAGTAPPAQRL